MKTVKYHVRRRARKTPVPREHGPKGTVKYNLKITARAPYKNVSQVTLILYARGGFLQSNGLHVASRAGGEKT